MFLAKNGIAAVFFRRLIATTALIMRRPEFEIRQLATFIVIGLMVNAIYVTFFLLTVWLNFEWRLIASTVAYTIACLFQYAANACLTFSKSIWNRAQILRYMATISLGYVLSTVFLTWISPPLRIPDFLALCAVAVSLPVLNFILFKGWVYKARGKGVASGQHDQPTDVKRRQGRPPA